MGTPKIAKILANKDTQCYYTVRLIWTKDNSNTQFQARVCPFRVEQRSFKFREWKSQKNSTFGPM